MKRELIEYGFVRNPYGTCVANKETPGGQLSVLWHIDDLKVSCKDRFEVTKLMQHLDKIYREKLVSHRGKKGNYLGMNLDYLEPEVFTVDQIPYIKNIIK